MTPERHRQDPLVGEDRLLQLPDGRTVSAWEGGDPAGIPVLFHSGTPSGRLQATLGHEAARRTGVRLLSFNRPGYGASSDLPPGLAQVGLDALDVLDQYDVDRVAVLGISGGGPYALATGLADQTRVTAVGIAAGVGPWTLIDDPDPDDWERPLLERAEAGDVAGARAGYAARAAEEFAWLSPGLSDEEVVDGFFAGAPPDAVAWLDPTFRLRWAADTRDALDRYDGYIRDNLSWGTTWDLDLGRLQVPCRLWYGAEDGMVPPRHGVWLGDHLPDARLEIRSGEGHGAVIFPRLAEIFAALTS
jgi:pimeloyl-ACP methyl ester carboxylesterase